MIFDREMKYKVGDRLVLNNGDTVIVEKVDAKHGEYHVVNVEDEEDFSIILERDVMVEFGDKDEPEEVVEEVTEKRVELNWDEIDRLMEAEAAEEEKTAEAKAEAEIAGQDDFDIVPAFEPETVKNEAEEEISGYADETKAEEAEEAVTEENIEEEISEAGEIIEEAGEISEVEETEAVEEEAEVSTEAAEEIREEAVEINGAEKTEEDGSVEAVTDADAEGETEELFAENENGETVEAGLNKEEYVPAEIFLIPDIKVEPSNINIEKSFLDAWSNLRPRGTYILDNKRKQNEKRMRRMW